MSQKRVRWWCWRSLELLLAGGWLTVAAPAGAVVPSPPPLTVAQRLAQAQSLLQSAPALARQAAYQALRQAEQEGDNPARLRCLTLLATASAYSNDPTAALRYDHQGLGLALQLGDSASAVKSCNGLASTLIDRRDTAQAWAILERGLRLVPRGRAGWAARGTLLNSVATMHFNEARYERAIFQARQALRLLGPTPDSTLRGVVSSLRGLLAECYANLGQTAQAEALLTQQLALDRRGHYSYFVVQNQLALANSLLARQQPAGLDTLAAALHLARRLGALPRVLEAYESYRNYYHRLGQFQPAFRWSERVRELSDSLGSLRQRQALVTANSFYANEAREAQIKALRERTAAQHRAQLGLLAAVWLLTLALAGAGWLLWELRRRDQQLARQHEALARATADAQRHAADAQRHATEAQGHAASKDRLYALVAHDLRGPLASFAGVSQLLEMYLQQQDRAGLAQVTTLLRQTGRQLNELLHNLLGWSLTQTGELNFAPRPLPVAPLLAETANFFAAPAAARQVQVQVEPSLPGLCAWADAPMLTTVLRNLVSNAVRYAPSGSGRVTLRAEALSAGHGTPAVCLRVQDNGSGMNARQIEELLQPLEARTPTPALSADPHPGTGLGLVLCLAFVRQHGGELHIESQPGRGTCVTVRLPAGPPEGAPPAAAPGPQP